MTNEFIVRMLKAWRPCVNSQQRHFMLLKNRSFRQVLRQRAALNFEQLEHRRLMAVDLRLLKDINTNLSDVNLLSHADVAGVTYLGARTTSGDALWRTDGTDTGTFVVREFRSEFSYLNHFTAVNDTLFFVVDSSLGK